MTPLGQRFIDEMTLRNLSPRTIEVYLTSLIKLGQHFNMCCEEDWCGSDYGVREDGIHRKKIEAVVFFWASQSPRGRCAQGETTRETEEKNAVLDKKGYKKSSESEKKQLQKPTMVG